MKKKHIILTILLSLIALSGVYSIFDNIFPKAEPVSCPDRESVIAFTLTRNGTDPATVTEEEISEILKNISCAKPSRITSVNDYPAAETYYTIEIDTKERQYRYFLYIKNSEAYIELPYEGIYKTDKQFFNYISALI